MNQKKKRLYNRKPLDKSFVPIVLALSVSVLHDSYHWGSKKRLPDFAEKLMDRLKQLEQGELEVSKVIEDFEALTGMAIK